MTVETATNFSSLPSAASNAGKIMRALNSETDHYKGLYVSDGYQWNPAAMHTDNLRALVKQSQESADTLAPMVGTIKTVRTQSPADHGNWHVCPAPDGEPRVYSKAEYPDFFDTIGTAMNAAITDPGFNPTTHFAGLVTQLGYTEDDYWDFVYVGEQVEV